MKKSLLLFALLSIAACKKDEAPPAGGGSPAPVKAAPAAPSGEWIGKVRDGKDLYATLKTNKGEIEVKLFSKDAPKTVENFVGLATGEREWRHPATGDLKKGVALYDGTIFHRVIEGFMIQGGDPLGTGTGNPGYQFEDEFQSGRTFDKVGLLAMANAGPGTNGSQFFITTSMPTYLNNKHTIFGEVVKGYDVVEAISKAPRGPRDRPIENVTIEHISLSETP